MHRMTSELLIDYISQLDPDTGRSQLLDDTLAALIGDAEQIARLESKIVRLERESAHAIATIKWERSVQQERLDAVRASSDDYVRRLREKINTVHRIGQAVLDAKADGRKTVRIADLTSDR